MLRALALAELAGQLGQIEHLTDHAGPDRAAARPGQRERVTVVPRGVLVERPSEYAELLARHATHEQVRFFLERRGRSLEEVRERHEHLQKLRRAVLGSVPADWRTAVVAREELDRFLFEPGDVVLVLGQDGLVANVAKYLDGQPVIGLNPEPDRVLGVLVRHPPQAAADLIADVDRRPRAASPSARWSRRAWTTARSCGRSTRSSSATSPTSRRATRSSSTGSASASPRRASSPPPAPARPAGRRA